MEENKRKSDQDQLRGNTMNETIREAHGNPDMDLNEVREGSEGNRGRTDEPVSGGMPGTESTQGVSYNPNDTSGARSGGISDMDDQTAGGAGQNTGARRGLGSHLRPKHGLTGSDYDGQMETS